MRLYKHVLIPLLAALCAALLLMGCAAPPTLAVPAGLIFVPYTGGGDSEADDAPAETPQPAADSREEAYREAERLLAEGRANLAGLAFRKLGTYKDAKDRSRDAWLRAAYHPVIAANCEHTVGVKDDGTVYTAGREGTDGAPRKKRYLDSWGGIVAVAAGREFSVGLKGSGKVVARGIDYHGECSLDDWSDVISIAAGKEFTLGLRSNGRVLAKGNNGFGQCDVDGWSDIVAVAAGEMHAVGLRADGTVVAKGYNTSGQCDVSGWKDIVFICAGAYHTVGVKSDGTVVAAGDDSHNQCDVYAWRNIVSVAAGMYHTIGLREDGTVAFCGYKSASVGRHANVSDWTDVLQIACGMNNCFAVRIDGHALSAGLNEYDQTEVRDWTDLRLPE